MNKRLKVEQIKEFSLSHSASVIGIAAVQRFTDAPKGHRPTDFLKNARSVIVQGIRLLPSVVDWHDYLKDSEYLTPMRRKQNAWYIYHRCGYVIVNYKLELLGLDMALFLENQGFRSMFLPATGGLDGASSILMIEHPEWYMARELAMRKEEEEYKRKGQRAGKGLGNTIAEFSHRHAAVLAGLGRFGVNNLVLTPEHGPRIRFMSVITEAEIEPDPLMEKELCLYFKTGCTKCIDSSCPFDCFSSLYRYELSGLKMAFSDFDKDKCVNDLNEGADLIGCGGICMNVCPVGRK